MLILRENPVEQFRFRIQSFNKKQRKSAETVELIELSLFMITLLALIFMRQTWQVKRIQHESYLHNTRFDVIIRVRTNLKRSYK